MIEVPKSSDASCPLDWNDIAPETITLSASGTDDGTDAADDCPPDFGQASQNCSGEDMSCEHAEMRGHERADLTMYGPAGSGHFAMLGLTIGNRHACVTASTVGWRNLYPVSDMLAPLPWLGDVDGDGDAELVVWSRLPWGDSEVQNGLMPVVYALDGDRLVRRDDKSHALRARVSAAYAKLAGQDRDPAFKGCFTAIATALK